MSNKPRISICMPSFNSSPYLEEAVLSVAFQRYENQEFFVHDGGSTDDSKEVLERHSHYITYWESVKDKGQSHATNKGFEKATGDIIGVLNSDDVLLPGTLEYVAKMFMRYPEMRWMTGDCLLFGIETQLDMMQIIIPTERNEWFYKWSISHPSTFVRREVIEQYGPYDEQFRYCLDYEYWMRLAFGGEELRYFKRPLSGFRWHDGSNSYRYREGFAKERDTIHDRYLAKLPPKEANDIRDQYKLMNLSNTIYHSIELLREGKRDEAYAWFNQVVKQYPEVKKTRAYYTTWLRLKLNRV